MTDSRSTGNGKMDGAAASRESEPGNSGDSGDLGGSEAGRGKIGVIGLGYVGLPLAVEFARVRSVAGFDIDPARISALRAARDETGELAPEDIAAADGLELSDDPSVLADCETYVVTVPTPVDGSNRPDLGPLRAASDTVGRQLRRGNLVIYESTVYPGATEEICVPILEAASGLAVNEDFHVGYSPERINPGDRSRTIRDVVKVTSGSTPGAARRVDALYREIVPAGTHLAPSIRVAEAAKVIENTQRDINIALVNEIAILFNLLGIDTEAVLEAAETKWNFLPFRPGLVGGHCIGVDPYYLAHKAEEVGHHPEIMLAGRRLNNAMGAYAAGRLVKRMSREGIAVNKARILVLGLAFKEDCRDLRNTRVVDLIAELEEFGARVDVHDPVAGAAEVERALGKPAVDPDPGTYDAIVLAVPHAPFRQAGPAWVRGLGRPGPDGRAGHVFFDLKSAFAESESDLRL